MLRVVVSANVPVFGGIRGHASRPFAALTLEGQSLRLRLRWIARIIRPKDLVVGPSSVQYISIARKFGFGPKIIDLALIDGSHYYFGTSQRDLILQHLEAAGFRVISTNI